MIDKTQLFQVTFVRNTQQVSEEAVGVSAFVRKKHTVSHVVP